MVGNNDPDTIAGLKARFGIPPDRRVVLYAPTFRPRADGAPRNPALALELGEMEDEIGSDHFLMVRTHYLDSISLPNRFAHFARSVNAHHDVTELLLITDVLVTDYSSVMFDFANLKRPMMFFALDHHEYVLHRGTYVDLPAIAPGPVVTTTEEVVKCLRDLDTVVATYSESLDRFHQQFCQYETGHAAESVVQRVFARDTPR